MNDLGQPIDNEDWVALGELFDRPGGPNRDTIFGLLHAVATAPSMIHPGVWLRVAFGEREFVGEPTAMMLLGRYSAVVEALAADRPLVPAPDEEQAIRDWCIGYTLGVDLDAEWFDYPDGLGPTFPIFVLAGDTQLNAPGEEHLIEDEEGWLREARENLVGVVMDNYEVLAPARRALASVGAIQRPVRRGPKVGRNAPCPCGSGKKYCLRTAN